MKPQTTPTPNPSSSASRPGTPWSADSLAITIRESTITAPTDRSMPAVRITSVWAMPSVPTTITCCTISDRLPGDRETVGGDAEEDHRDQQHDQRAERRVGVQDVVDLAPERGLGARGSDDSLPCRRAAGAGTSLRDILAMVSTPAVREAEGRVLGRDAVDRLVGDQGSRRC